LADATETKLVGVTIAICTYNAIVAKLKPLESAQDYIRDAINEKLAKEA
jgi:hypothetical protein